MGPSLQCPEAVDCRFDCTPSGLPESADRGVAHRPTNIAKDGEVGFVLGRRARAEGDSDQRLFLANRANATGHTLPARFVTEERGNAAKEGG